MHVNEEDPLPGLGHGGHQQDLDAFRAPVGTSGLRVWGTGPNHTDGLQHFSSKLSSDFCHEAEVPFSPEGKLQKTAVKKRHKSTAQTFDGTSG